MVLQELKNNTEMEIKQYNYTKFVSTDGSEWDTEEAAIKRDNLVERVNQIMQPLGPIHPDVEDAKGWVQHDLEVVNTAKDEFLDLCRELKYNEDFPAFNSRDSHPLSTIGRIISDLGGPLDTTWTRFCCIDVQGREHQKPYFAYFCGPYGDHYCVEDRRK